MIIGFLSKIRCQLSSIGACWLVCDPKRTNYAPFYGGFEEIGVLEVEAVFHWLYEFGLDVQLGMDEIRI